MTRLRTHVQAAPVGHPAYSQTFPCEPETAEAGRRLVRHALSVWRLDDVADHAVLITSELMANAARHTTCPSIRLLVGRPATRRVRIGVVDRAPSRLPVLGLAAADDESGRGLLLIDAIADRWGYDLHRRGRCVWAKEVWAELRVEAAQ
ncbi:ATP-binding protein [Streptomyces sp. NPDC093085]|uniref:ATP-binding protein n=1 Tax=Streptomyces sp. NPDC093085 TaxID=3155068 RepID=UPI00342A492E